MRLHLAGHMGQRGAEFVELGSREMEQLGAGVWLLGPKLRERIRGRIIRATDYRQVDVRPRPPVSDRPRAEQQNAGAGQLPLQFAHQLEGTRIGCTVAVRQGDGALNWRQSFQRDGHEGVSELRSHGEARNPRGIVRPTNPAFGHAGKRGHCFRLPRRPAALR